MLYLVEVRSLGKTFTISCERTGLDSLVTLLEDSPKVTEFKVAGVGTIYSQNVFGFAEFKKWVTKFNWSKE